MEQLITIPKPCHEDWDKMNPNEKGRFCNLCNKTVVDFTKMNKDEIHTYFKQNVAQKTCGHFKVSQLDTKQTEKPSVFKRINYLATLVFGLFLPFSSCKKQVTGEPSLKNDSVVEKELTGDTVYSGSDHRVPPPVIENKTDTLEQEKIVKGVTLVKPDSIKK